MLDSVVVQDLSDPMYLASFSHSATVLRAACRAQSCPSDPANDLAVTLRRYGGGVAALNALITLSIIDPTLSNPNFAALDRLRKAADGDPGPWRDMLGWFTAGDDPPAEMFSAGLHLAALCADFPEMPWGDSSAPLAGRDDAVDRAVAKLSADAVWPFPKHVAGEHGFIANCMHWPPSRPKPAPRYDTLTMPVLLLQGDRDLSTPLAWAREQLADTPQGRLVVVPGAGHSVQRRYPAGARAATDFLLA